MPKKIRIVSEVAVWDISLWRGCVRYLAVTWLCEISRCEVALWDISLWRCCVRYLAVTWLCEVSRCDVAVWDISLWRVSEQNNCCNFTCIWVIKVAECERLYKSQKERQDCQPASSNFMLTINISIVKLILSILEHSRKCCRISSRYVTYRLFTVSNVSALSVDDLSLYSQPNFCTHLLWKWISS
jgi:hypothetical protein